MATIPTPTIYTYTEINPGKFAGVRHYELQEVKNGCNSLSEKINISKDRNFAKSNPDYWVKVREGNKWQTPALTGLFKTKYKGVFKGDTQRKKNLILAHFTDDASQVNIYFFQNFYTSEITHLVDITVR